MTWFEGITTIFILSKFIALELLLELMTWFEGITTINKIFSKFINKFGFILELMTWFEGITTS